MIQIPARMVGRSKFANEWNKSREALIRFQPKNSINSRTAVTSRGTFRLPLSTGKKKPGEGGEDKLVWL